MSSLQGITQWGCWVRARTDFGVGRRKACRRENKMPRISINQPSNLQTAALEKRYRNTCSYLERRFCSKCFKRPWQGQKHFVFKWSTSSLLSYLFLFSCVFFFVIREGIWGAFPFLSWESLIACPSFDQGKSLHWTKWSLVIIVC